jgi:orotidine-5'-phosphate decarboxylase
MKFKKAKTDGDKMKIIKLDRSIIPACDVATLEALEKLVKETCDVKRVGGYKIGFELVIPFGMNSVIGVIRKHTALPIIYDHQKAGTDIPDTGEKFMKACKGVDAVILFPQAGPETERKWIEAAKKEGLGIIIGGEMTHPKYLENDGGFILNTAPQAIYELAASLGVSDFVVPGNKPERIVEYRRMLEARGIKPVFYSPGMITQGGDISEAARAAGERWHAIIGRALYQASDMRKTAEDLSKKLF